MSRLWPRLLILSALGLSLSISPAMASQPPAQADLLNEDVIGEGVSESEATEGAIAKINHLDRSENGFTTLTWTLDNPGSGTIPLPGDMGDATYLYTGQPLSGITLHDPVSDVRFHPLMDDETQCICSAGSGWIEITKVVRSNQYATYWSTYLLPEDVDAVTVEIPGFEPIEDVPVE